MWNIVSQFPQLHDYCEEPIRLSTYFVSIEMLNIYVDLDNTNYKILFEMKHEMEDRKQKKPTQKYS